MANRFSANFRSRAQAGMIPAAVMQMTIAGTTYRYSDQPVASRSQGMFKPQVIDWGGTLVEAADDRNSNIEPSDLSVTIADHDDTLSNLFFGQNRRAVFNSTAKIYLAYSDIAFSDWFTLFTGRVATKDLVEPKVWKIGLRYDDTSLAGDTADFITPIVDEKAFPTAPDASLGKQVPLVYGKREWDGTGQVGDIQAIYCSSDGDPSSSTAPHRFVVCLGHATNIPNIWANGVAKGSYVKDTDWFWTERNGIYFTEIGYSGAPNGTYSEPITCNVWGMSTDGDGSVTEADLITNPARQIENFIVNFAFNRWRSGSWYSQGKLGSTPLDGSSIVTLEDFFDDAGVIGSAVLRSGAALAVLNGWLGQHFCAAWWNEEGKIQFGFRNPYDSDIYLDNNTPANWPWFQTPRHGRGEHPAFPLAEDDSRIAERITMNINFVDKDSRYSAAKFLQDYRRTSMNSEEAIDMSWARAEYGTSHNIDAMARRLRRDRFSNMQMAVNASPAMLDPDLFDSVLISDPTAPSPSGSGWGNDAIWKPRLMSLVRRSFNLATKETSCILEDERFFRTTFFDSGTGEIGQTGAQKIAQGVYNGRASNGWTFARGTAAWVPNLSGNIVKLGNTNTKRTPDGWLMEPKAENYLYNPAFVAGWTNWSVTGSGTSSLITTGLLFEDETADDLSGTNQVARLATTAGPSTVRRYQTTARSFGASEWVAFSVYHKDSGNPLRIIIQNPTTGNYLNTAGGWQGSICYASNFSLSNVWTRDSIKFQMESTGSTLRVDLTSPADAGTSTDVGHVQIEDDQHYLSVAPKAVVTSPKVSGASATFVGNADQFYVENDSATGRSFEWWNQGTFRCVWQPIVSETDLLASGFYATIFCCKDTVGNRKFSLYYSSAGAGAGQFVSGYGASPNGQVVLTDTWGVTAGQQYKIILKWTGANGEHGQSQGYLKLLVYDPVGQTWYTDGYQATQLSAVDGNFYLASEPVYQGWGYYSDSEVSPSVLSDEECKDYP